MRTSILLLIGLLSTATVHSQRTVAGYTIDPKGPKLTNKVEAQFPDEGIAMGLGGMIRIYMDVVETGQASVVGVAGGPAPCSNLEDPRAVQLREAAITAARTAVFEPITKKGSVDAIVILQFGIPFPPPPDSEKGRPRYISGGVLNGKATSLPKPVYPVSVHGSGAKGAVSVIVTVGTDGKVIGAAGFSGDTSLFDAASKAACSARFPPILLSGNPIMVSGTIEYNFVPKISEQKIEMPRRTSLGYGN